MPRFIDSDLRTTDMVTGANRVLMARGIPELTMRMIARESGISTGSLIHHFDSRKRLLRIAAHRTGQALVAAAESDSLWIGLDAFLPGDVESMRLTRAWPAWCELWRSEPWLGSTVSDLREHERRALAVLHERPTSDPGLDTVLALLDGFGRAVCAPVTPMDVERARLLLRAGTAAALGRPT